MQLAYQFIMDEAEDFADLDHKDDVPSVWEFVANDQRSKIM